MLFATITITPMQGPALGAEQTLGNWNFSVALAASPETAVQTQSVAVADLSATFELPENTGYIATVSRVDSTGAVYGTAGTLPFTTPASVESAPAASTATTGLAVGSLDVAFSATAPVAAAPVTGPLP